MNMKSLGWALACLMLLSACGSSDENTTADEAPPQAPAVSVRVEPVQTTTLQRWVYSQGTARSLHREYLTFTEQGKVTFVDPALRVGMPVEAGQLIAHQAPERLEAELASARAALNEAQANLQLAQVTQERYQRLIDQRSASAQELDQARVEVQQALAARDSARAQIAQAELMLEESRLVSPIDGVLARLNIEQGRYFMPSTVDTTTEQGALQTVPALVIDPASFEVRVDLPSYNFGRVEEGARVIIGARPPQGPADADPESLSEGEIGEVYAVSPSLDPQSRTFEIIVRTSSEHPRLQDGAFVGVWMAEPERVDALSVPFKALRFLDDRAFVFVYDEEAGRAEERSVTLGQQAGERREVLEGLAEGERVVTDGRTRLTDGDRVSIVEAAP
ncbi:efflux RND transporter periplasmic adaptor subunit [Halomonas sp. 707D7]|uniref:efflux RND transporter periplasmic adaptor subunit n=2 Tax=unclassified Halomonas TaxID=2609666 RepID=UPI00209D9FA0|nr:efflux RND transporter periplasmic adaptor subunit [Halomonas sp. 707D7]MCP1315589.1 efflux RND transporter periplasmic adaptor subunit [Halomonas sp. 707D7]